MEGNPITAAVSTSALQETHWLSTTHNPLLGFSSDSEVTKSQGVMSSGNSSASLGLLIHSSAFQRCML